MHPERRNGQRHAKAMAQLRPFDVQKKASPPGERPVHRIDVSGVAGLGQFSRPGT
jgi:hypothetical protein